MAQTPPLEIGISPCPNDTYTFAALLEQRVPAPPLHFTLGDVQQLNEGLRAGRFDVAKASFHAALKLARDYVVLPVGAALGFGVGPLLLSSPQARGRIPGAGDRVLCPGAWTTATLLYHLFCPQGPAPTHVIFSAIMPALARGEADFGVVIHEGRFTYADHGLHLAQDLGECWERATCAPLPLGGIIARRAVGADVRRQVTQAIRASLQVARADPTSAFPQMRQHAQEFSDRVLMQHVDLYVNDATADLGDVGRRSLRLLAQQARQVGLLDEDVDLEVDDA